MPYKQAFPAKSNLEIWSRHNKNTTILHICVIYHHVPPNLFILIGQNQAEKAVTSVVPVRKQAQQR